MQALQNIYEYLLDAESQMGTDKPEQNVNNYSAEGDHSVPVAAGAGDTNICGGIVQLYWDNILGRCLDFNEQVRQTALKVGSCFSFTIPVQLTSVTEWQKIVTVQGKTKKSLG